MGSTAPVEKQWDACCEEKVLRKDLYLDVENVHRTHAQINHGNIRSNITHGSIWLKLDCEIRPFSYSLDEYSFLSTSLATKGDFYSKEFPL